MKDFKKLTPKGRWPKSGYTWRGWDAAKFGAAVRAVRKHMGLTQEQVGKKAGVGRLRVLRIEKGRANPRLLDLTKIARAMGGEVKVTIKK